MNTLAQFVGVEESDMASILMDCPLEVSGFFPERFVYLDIEQEVWAAAQEDK